MSKLDSSAILLSLILIAALLVMTERNLKEAHKDFMNLSKQVSDLDAHQENKFNELRVLVLQEQLSARPTTHQVTDVGVADSADSVDARAKD